MLIDGMEMNSHIQQKKDECIRHVKYTSDSVEMNIIVFRTNCGF